MQPRKTLYTANDPVIGFALSSGPNDRLEQIKLRVLRRFGIQLEDLGFTTHVGVVEEFTEQWYHDGEARFTFPRDPKYGDHIELRGGPQDGTQGRYAGKDQLETLHYSDDTVIRHYYTLHGLDVATGRWIYRHER